MPSIDLDLNASTHESQPQDAPTSPLPEGRSHDDVLKDLQAQVRIIGKIKPSLSELAACYQQRKSRIDQFVEWYANQPLWGKILAGGLVVSASYTIGAFSGVAWLLMGLVSALYTVAIVIIEEHADLMRKRDALFLDDLPKMEATLQASIESFRALEDKLTTVFLSLNQLSIQRAEGISEFEENVGIMGGHNLQYNRLIQSLGETAAKISAHQEGVALDKAELDGLCSEFQDRLQEAEILTSTLSGLISTVEQELQDNVSHSLDPQSEVEAPRISEKTSAHFSEIEREVELHRKSRNAMNTGNTVHTAHFEEAFLVNDQAIQKLLQENNARKARAARSEKGSGGIVLSLPALF